MSVVEDIASAPDSVADPEPRRSFTKEVWFLIVVAIALAFFMKTFLIQAFYIPSGSMEKTLHGCSGAECVDGRPADRVLVNKLVYKFRDVHRGEIVVFNGKGTGFSSAGEITPPRNTVDKIRRKVLGFVGFGGPGDKDFIKRVIGIPGDVVACCTDGKVTVNGQPLDEPYVFLSDDSTPQASFNPVTVPDGELFVMGDHRDGSSDSRYNGTIPVGNVVGRAFAVFYPFTARKILEVPDTFDPAAGAAPHALGIAFAMPVTVLSRRVRRTTD